MAGLEPAASSLVPHLPALPAELHWLVFALPGGAILRGALPVFPGRQQYFGEAVSKLPSVGKGYPTLLRDPVSCICMKRRIYTPALAGGAPSW